MSKKTHTPETLAEKQLAREAAAAVEKWRESAAREQSARDEYREYATKNPIEWRSRGEYVPSPAAIGQAAHEIKALECAAQTERDAVAAALLLDQLEVATGDEAACARDLRALHKGLVECDEKAQELIRAQQENETKRWALIKAAQAGEAAIAKRRSEANQPFVPILPAFPMFITSGELPLTARVAQALQNGPTARSRDAEIRNAQNDITRCAAELRERELEKAAREEKAAAQRRAIEEEQEAQRRAEHAKAAEAAAEREALRNDRERLAGEYFANQGGAR